MPNDHNIKRFTTWLAATAFILVTATAAAHEIEHDLEQHDDPTCALHLYTSHAGKITASDAGPAVSIAPAFYMAISIRYPPHTRYVLGYRGRAPPSPISFVS